MKIAERVLNLEGVHNFRDYGGYPVRGGGRLRRGVLWRSGQHHGATEADLSRIADLNLTSVFDLRSSRERTAHPCKRPEGFAARVFLGQDPERKKEPDAPHVAAAMTTKQRDAESTRMGLLRNYGKICFRPELQAMMRSYLAELAGNQGPSLINCMAGKDRTGISVALVQTAAGVHRDDVIADYVLTNTAGDPEARIAAGAETIRAISGVLDDDVLRVLMGVEPEYLEAAFVAIDEEHGSVDAYLRNVLGADEALREKLRDALVEG